MPDILPFILLNCLFFIASLILYTLLGLIILLITKLFKKAINTRIKKLLKTTALFAAIATVLVIFFTAKILLNPPSIDAAPQKSISGAIGAGFAAGIASAFILILGLMFSILISFFLVGLLFIAYLIISIIQNKYN